MVQRVMVISPRLKGAPPPPMRPRTMAMPDSGARRWENAGRVGASARWREISAALARARMPSQDWRSVGLGRESYMYRHLYFMMGVGQGIFHKKPRWAGGGNP